MIQDLTQPIIISLLAEVGYDFIVLDQEHGPSTYRDVQNLVLAAKRTEMAILVRSTNISHEFIAKILDMGADGLMIPHVDTKEEALEIIKYAKFPPVGSRSWGMRTVLSKIPGKNNAEYIINANNSLITLVQVECAESAEIIEEIISIPYIDGVIIGPADFTMSLGVIGQFSNAEFVQYAENVLKSCQKHGKGFGIHFGDVEDTKKWVKKGMNILLHSNVKRLIKERATRVLADLKGEEPSENANPSDPY